MPKHVSHFRDVSGGPLRGCAFVIDRYREDLPWSSKDTITWVGVVEADGSARLIRGERAWYTDVWCSDSGTVYLTVDDDLLIGTRAATGSYQWRKHPLGFRAWGVWGLSDEQLYVWGFDGRQQLVASIQPTGTRHIPVPAPVVSMAGISEDVLYVAGEQGLLARFDGAAFVQVPVQEHASFNRVVVVSDQEIYASTRSGAVWEGSVHGMSPLPAAPGDLLGVAKLSGALYAANEWGGLHRLDGVQWAKVQVPAKVRKAWGGESLVMMGPDDLLETRDFVDYTRVTRASLKPVFTKAALDSAQPVWVG